MKPTAQSLNIVRFGVFEFDLRSGELRKQGRKVRLEGQPAQILLRLLEHPGELMSREELQKQLWSADTFVDFERSLNAAVKRLRRALGDSPGNPRFVETLARRGYRFIAPVSHGNTAPHTPPSSSGIHSLAVLPFENAGDDPETEYLSDGITESIINNLSQLPVVRVMARCTVFRYKDKTVDPRSVGRKLNVQAVLLGRVLQRGDSLVIGAELVEVRNGWQLWGEQYNRRLADIFSVEEEISKEISTKLRLRLSGEDRTRLAKRHTQSTEAYQDYLKGRYHWNLLSEDGLRKSIEFFRRSIQKDPAYALAYAGLADSFNLLGFFGLLPADEVIPRAKEAALKALVIDEGIAEAHSALATVLKVYDRDWLASEREFLRALRLNPNYATAHRGYAAFLSSQGRTDEAVSEIQKAQELDPFSLAISMEMGWIFYMARRHEQALEQALKTLEMEPRFTSAHHVLGLAYEQLGRMDEAIAAFRHSATESESHAATVAGLGHALARAGRQNEARGLYDQLQELSRRTNVSPYWPAILCAGLGENAAALHWLESAYEQHDVWLVWLKTEPRFDPIRPLAQFQNLLRRAGFAIGIGRAAE